MLLILYACLTIIGTEGAAPIDVVDSGRTKALSSGTEQIRSFSCSIKIRCFVRQEPFKKHRASQYSQTTD